jgi:hypothetical protein
MELSSILFLIVFLSIFSGIIYLAIRASSNDQKAKQELASTLGFTPTEAHAALLAKISRLYQRGKNKYEMRNVFHKKLPDGEMYLFDLVETSGEDDSWTETQAVAVISSYLKLPHFTLFPKADQKYALSGVANKILEWGMSFVGKPIPFPEFPAFNDKYVVTSNESDLARIYLDENLLRYFSQTQMYMLHAMGDIFTFNEMDPKFGKMDQESMSRRINRAMEIFRVLQK